MEGQPASAQEAANVTPPPAAATAAQPALDLGAKASLAREDKEEEENDDELLAVAEATPDGYVFTLPLIIPDTPTPMRSIRMTRKGSDIAVAGGGALHIDVSDGILHPLLQEVWLLPRRALQAREPGQSPGVCESRKARAWTHVTLLVWEDVEDEERSVCWDGTYPELTPRCVARLAGSAWSSLFEDPVDAVAAPPAPAAPAQ